MSIIKNALLLPIQHLIGQAPTPTPAVLDTESVSLTMPITPEIARRSLASQPTGGWFVGILENNHVSDDAIISTVNVYRTGDDTVPPWPTPVPNEFDVWWLGVCAQHASGSGGLSEALVGFNPAAFTQGWGRDQAGAIVVNAPRMHFARFDAIAGGATGSADPPLLTEAGETYVSVNMRLPRGTNLSFQTLSTGAATVEFKAMFVMGLFPSAMGQDVVT